jgi:hypothetical protein
MFVLFFLMLIVPTLSSMCFTDGEGGFLGYSWGTPLAEMRERFGLHPVEAEDGRVTFRCHLESLAGANLESCELEFLGGRFAGVAITTKGTSNSHELLSYLVQFYGPRPRERVVAYQWLTGDTHISYDIDSAGDGYAYWYSLRLQQTLDSSGVN